MTNVSEKSHKFLMKIGCYYYFVTNYCTDNVQYNKKIIILFVFSCKVYLYKTRMGRTLLKIYFSRTYNLIIDNF